MGIKKGLAVLLVFGLLLMGVTPVLAAGEQVKAAATAQQGEAVQVVVPEGEEVSVVVLENTFGDGIITFSQSLGAFLSGVDMVLDDNPSILHKLAGSVLIISGWTGMLVGAFAPSP